MSAEEISIANIEIDGIEPKSPENNEYTHIMMILDRSGSMMSIRDDMIGGFNKFLEDQKSLDGKATMTLVQFDSDDPFEVLRKMGDIQLVPNLTHEIFIPRGCTPLLDAIGRGIAELESSLSKMDKKPGKIVFAIVTDGYENASSEFTKDQITKMIGEKKENWQFVFLGADLGGIAEAGSYGISVGTTMSYDANSVSVAGAWGAVSHSLTNYRSGNLGQDFSFSDEDRAKQESEKKRRGDG